MTTSAFFARVTITIATLVAAACATSPVTSDRRDAIQQKSVGVVSLLGDDLHGVYAGFTRLTDEGFSAQVPEWQLDRVGAERFVEQLKSKGYSAKTIRASEATTSYYRPNSFIEGEQLLDVDRLAALASREQVDTLVVIKQTFPNRADGNEQSFKGAYGLFYHNILGIKKSAIYTLIAIEVVDVAQRKVIAKHRAASWTAWSEDVPSWHPSFTEYSPSDQQIARQMIQTQLLDRINTAASELKF